MISRTNISKTNETYPMISKLEEPIKNQNSEQDLKLPIGEKNLSLDKKFSFNQIIELLSAAYGFKILNNLENN